MALTPVASSSGSLASGTTATITLPAYQAGDFLLLIVSRNNTETNPFTYSTAVSSLVELQNVGTRRLTALRVNPNGLGQSSFTLTSVTSSVWSWWIGVFRGPSLTATVNGAANAIGNSTTSPVEIPASSLGYIATGNEYAIAAAGVNATATWTTDSNTLFSTSSALNAGLMVSSKAPAAGSTAVGWAAMDRGLAGTARNESSLSLVLQVAPVGTTNLLANPSFESGSTIATSWADEHTTAGAATYSLTSSNVSDGSLAQRMQYTGQAGDNGTTSSLEIFQSPVPGVVPGDVLTFTVKMSGTMTNVYAIVGIESFDSSNVYISETDANVLTITSTPTDQSVTYTCPTGTDHVAVFVKFPGVASTSVVDVTLDAARLVKSSAPVSRSGTASGTVALAGASAGTSTHRGTAAGTFATAGTSAGAATHRGTSAGTVPFAGAATGSSSHRGTSSGTVTLAGAASGTTTHRGTSTGATVFADSATGRATHRGTGSATFTYTASASGSSGAGGVASSTVTFTGAAVGTTPRKGGSSGTFTVASSASGTAPHQGSGATYPGSTYPGPTTYPGGSASFTFTAAAVGVAPVVTATPAGRVYSVPGEVRAYTVGGESRAAVVSVEARTFTVEVEPRTATVPAEPRTYTVVTENRAAVLI